MPKHIGERYTVCFTELTVSKSWWQLQLPLIVNSVKEYFLFSRSKFRNILPICDPALRSVPTSCTCEGLGPCVCKREKMELSIGDENSYMYYKNWSNGVDRSWQTVQTQIRQLLKSLKSTKWTNSADPDQMPHIVASDQGLHCLLTGFSIKYKIKYFQQPKMTNETVQKINSGRVHQYTMA